MLAERLGCNDVRAHPQDPTGQRRRDGADVGVATKHEMRAAHSTVRRVHGDFRSVFIAQHPGILENVRAGGFGGSRDALGELERVQVAAARVDEPSEVMIAADVPLQLLAVQQPCRAVVIILVQFTHPNVQFLQMSRLDGDVDMVGVILAIDGVLADQRLREIQGFDGQVEQAPCVIAADLGHEAFLTRRKAEDGLPSAAPGGSIADDMRLEQGDPVAALRQMQCSRAAGDAAAEHRHIDPMLAAQRFSVRLRAARRQGRGGGDGRGVVGGSGWVGQAQRSSLLGRSV